MVNPLAAQVFLINSSFKTTFNQTRFDQSKKCGEGYIAPPWEVIPKKGSVDFIPGGFDNDGYVRLYVGGESKGKHLGFIGCPLNENLQKGEHYIISVSLLANFYFSKKELIGIAFLEDRKDWSEKDLVKIQPNILFPYSLVDSLIAIPREYVATGKEKFIIIGHFANAEERLNVPPHLVYTIDDVKITKRPDPSKSTKANPELLASYKETKIDKRFVLEDITFEFDKSTLNVESLSVLDSVYSIIADGDYDSIYVNGHTDSIGSDAYNDDLSISRARSVATYLASKSTLPLNFIISGFGWKYPLVLNGTPENRRKNRRVEIILRKTLP